MVERRPIPDRIRDLRNLASDLWWSWHPGVREVFRVLDYTLWRHTQHNPVEMLAVVSSQRLDEVARDPSFLALYDDAIEELNRARSGAGTWWSQNYGHLSNFSVAYFSAEFAVHQSVPLYAGGLGVLAGDHCKEASDLGIPLIGVGFRYSTGYFRQRISADGWQLEDYTRFRTDATPLERLETAAGHPLTIQVPLGQGNIRVAVWLLRLGCVRLFLLDTDVDENQPWQRELSSKLYVSEREARLQQEIILGIGGVRVLRSLGYSPALWHLNEGHAAFVVFERIRELIEAGESFERAFEQVRSTTVFTTHTPVAAGHDTFSFEAVDRQLESFWGPDCAWRNRLLSLARYENWEPLFNMTVLALRSAASMNAVSETHCDVTRKLFGPILSKESAVQPVTNGIHVSTWIAPAVDALFSRHLGDNWRDRQDEPELWEGILQVPDKELWDVRQSLKSYLLTFIREHTRYRWTHEQASANQIAACGALLDPAALTIGFARRFTEYKRSELIFRDPDRLCRLLNSQRMPVQLIFAGKAHPADHPGKSNLQRIYHRASDPKFSGRVAFVDDYDLHVAHFLVQGCDVWLNNPQRPLEACGTSGMKASINGVPHLSVADGWWSEGYTGSNGWLIDSGDDQTEADSLYRLLEEQLVPAYYSRDAQGVRERWVAVIKEAIRTVAPRFCARRMVKQYVRSLYAPKSSVMTVSV